MDRCASMTRLPATTLPATVSGGAPKRAFAGWRALIVSSHPNRSRRVTPAANPTPEQIRSARDAAGLTQTEAARLIHCTLRGWQDWEGGQRRMHPAFFELFTLKAPAYGYNPDLQANPPPRGGTRKKDVEGKRGSAVWISGWSVLQKK